MNRSAGIIIAPETVEELSWNHRIWQSHATADYHLDAELWSRILYDFIGVYQGWRRNCRRLVDLLTPLCFGRVKSSCERVWTLDMKEAEAVIREQAEIFTRNKSYLLARIEEAERPSVSSA